MSFRLIFFGIESTRVKKDGGGKPKKETKMAKKKTSKKKRLTPHQKKFRRVVQLCHKTTKTKEKFGKCLSKELKSKKGKK